jgi:trans-aconitate methyltransferase
MEPRAVVFGREAGAYEAARPGYPAEAVRHVLARTEVRSAVEVGAGTGKATESFAPLVEEIVCVEPSAAMAAVLQGKALPGVEVVVAPLERWTGPEAPVDLVYAAQAWHWVDHSTAYARVRDMLRPGGVVALIWNLHGDRDRGRYELFADVYRSHAPEVLNEWDERIRRRDTETWLDELATAGFESVDLFTHQWSRSMSPEGARALYATYSDHIMIPEPRRSRLLEALEEAVRDRGDEVTLDYRTNVFSGVNPGQ